MSEEVLQHVAESVILAVDTSGANASLAIARGSRELASIAVSNTRQHSQVIFEQLEMLLRLAEIPIEEINVFAAVTGPGSFTGLRIGLAAIKGLAQPRERAVVGIDAFDAHAGELALAGRCAILIDAGRGEVYIGLRHVDESGEPREIRTDFVASLETALETIGNWSSADANGGTIIGSGALRYARKIAEIGLEKGIPIELTEVVKGSRGTWQLLRRPQFLASWVARSAIERLHSGSNCLIPYYLKASDAEVKWKTPAT